MKKQPITQKKTLVNCKHLIIKPMSLRDDEGPDF